ncbi:MAG: hypothetical protein QXD48_01335 [Candidatus Aenigmatarchaeota archaeon]
MFFSKKDKYEDIEKIKEVVNDIPELPEIEPKTYRHEEMSMPLFVKVDKYKELLSGIQEMKLFVSGAKQLFSILQEIETIRSDALKIMHATVQRLEKSIIEMDSELIRPRGADLAMVPERPEDIKQIENSLNELQRQLLDLRKELQELK